MGRGQTVSKMKRYLEELSEEMGLDGEITDEVMDKAYDRLPITLVVRTGLGTVRDNGFNDEVAVISRVPRRHAGWRSIQYKGWRYQLHGGVRTASFICLNNPIKKND